MKTETKLLPSIQIQAAIALMLIQLVHKIVREIPGAIKMGGPGAIGVPIFPWTQAILIIYFCRLAWKKWQ